MEILKSAAAGTLESSDCLVTVEPGDGINLELTSSVMNQYGRQIKATILETLERLGAENPSIKNMLPRMIFAGIEEGVVTVEFESRSINVRGVLEKKTALIEAALSSAFGQSMRLRFRNVGEGPVKMNAEAKKTINQAYDIFGRDKIELTD